MYIVTEPNWFINEFDGLEVASTHGSPWKYDTHVPVIFAGHGLSTKVIYRNVETVDVALTLSNYLRIKPPYFPDDHYQRYLNNCVRSIFKYE